MSLNQPARTRLQSALLAALPERSRSPSRHSEDEVPIQLNQGQSGGQENADESGPSAFDNPVFDESNVVESFHSLALQQKQQQRQNQQLFQLVAKLSEKIDDLAIRNRNGTSTNNGYDNSSPSHDGERDNVTTGDRSENNDDEDGSDSEDGDEQRFVDHTYYRHKIGEGFSHRQPSDLAPSKPGYFNIDDQVSRSLSDTKFSAKRQEYQVTVANAFFAAVANEAQKDAIEAFQAGNHTAALKLFKQVSANLKAASDMQGDRMLFLNINSDPGATSKQKSFANDILRNEFTPGVTDRGGSSSTQRKFQLYEEQCLKATIGASAKAQANRHLGTGSYGASGAGTIPKPKKPAEGKGKIGTGKSTGQPKSALKEGSFLKKNGQEKAQKTKKQARIEAQVGSESG